jgi:hypothetical protein
MAERKRTSVPAGDVDLTGGHASHGENIRDGGVGPSGSSFTSTGKLGGIRETSNGNGSRTDGDPSAEDHTSSGGILDTDAPLRRHKE